MLEIQRLTSIIEWSFRREYFYGPQKRADGDGNATASGDGIMGGLCGGGSNNSSNSNSGSNSSSSNSFSENLANSFTPNDGASYVNGQLVDDRTGERIAAGGTSSAGRTIAGTANSERNDYTGPIFSGGSNNSVVSNSGPAPSSNTDDRYFSPEQLGALTTVNSGRENMANMFTPFDGAKYVGGNLIEEATGRSLTGGGFITNKMGDKDYIYGVSDDFSNNAPLDQGKMSNQDYAVALQKFKIRQSQLENIPPSDPAYFSSFIPGLTIPFVGGYLGEKMLEGGINERRAMMDQHQAALNAGATPNMSEDGKVYLGYKGADGKDVFYIENKKKDPLTDSSLGALNMVNDRNDDRPAPVVLPPETGTRGGGDTSRSGGTGLRENIPIEPIPMDPNTIVYASPMYEKFQFEVLPGLLKQMPNMTQDDIDAAFILYRDRQNAAE
jgi:hypothetical protein